jgi:hypothetical protein
MPERLYPICEIRANLCEIFPCPAGRTYAASFFLGLMFLWHCPLGVNLTDFVDQM